jgi:hypothetical protein
LRDLSLHLLDLMENSIRAGASTLAVTVELDRAADRLTLVVEDDGGGFAEQPELVADPFFTTKPGKRVGLGLSLFRASAELAGGSFALERSALGGACVRATLRVSHVDRQPLGDLAATLSSVVCTNPGLEVICRLRAEGQERVIASNSLVAELPGRQPHSGLALARRMSERVKQGLSSLKIEST